MEFNRRVALRMGVGASATVAAYQLFGDRASGAVSGYGPLGPVNANGLRLPPGFTSRIIARTGQPVGSTGYVWPANPDGAGTFPAANGGWYLVVNSEVFTPNGGASSIRFRADGTIAEAKRILNGTNNNCAGGPTPWGTWLSCEEVDRGAVWEVNPSGATAAQRRTALGRFAHEAVAYNTTTGLLYMTEDKPDGGCYRFRPTRTGDLSAGTLEVMTEIGGAINWAVVPDPSASATPCRYQVANIKRFNGGEGICTLGGSVYFTTKGDNRVWKYRIPSNTLSILYDDAFWPQPVLTGVDNAQVRPNGDLFVAEDGGDMQVVMVRNGIAAAVAQVSGTSGSEITGITFSPNGNRLYFNSQRNPGVTYEVTGPF